MTAAVQLLIMVSIYSFIARFEEFSFRIQKCVYMKKFLRKGNLTKLELNITVYIAVSILFYLFMFVEGVNFIKIFSN